MIAPAKARLSATRAALAQRAGRRAFAARGASSSADATRAPSHRCTRLAVTLALAATSLIVFAGGSGAPPASADSCPNAQLRPATPPGYSAYLPDCRAYELVTPPGAQPFIQTTRQSDPRRNLVAASGYAGAPLAAQAAPGGDALAFFTMFAPAGSAVDSGYFRATRGDAGWATQGIAPPQSVSDTGVPCFNAYPAAYSPNFDAWILADGWHQEDGCGTDDPTLVSGEPAGFQNLFARDASGSYQLINLTPPAVAPDSAWFQGASSDLTRVVFDEPAQLTPDAPPVPAGYGHAGYDDNLYESSAGQVHLVTILPDGTPVQGLLANRTSATGSSGNAGPGAGIFTHAVSSDGSRVLFVANGNLYLRQNPDRPQSPLGGGGDCLDLADACTLQVDAPAAGAAGPGGGSAFQWASTDGSHVFFTDDASAGLTADTVPGSGQNLYRYDVSTRELTNLTAGPDARVDGVSGTSDDGSAIYFVAEAALAPGASADQPNLYLARGGETTFIAALDPTNDSLDWNSLNGVRNGLTARVSPDGRFLTFNSLSSLTGYDNTPADPGDCRVPLSGGGFQSQPCQETFVYDAVNDRLSCASCAPGGAAATAPAHIAYQEGGVQLVVDGVPGYLRRNLSDDGHLYFDTPQALLPRDTNGQSDVYGWAPPGTSGCTQAVGCLSLISTGTSPDPSYFYDASSSGNDVFIYTSQSLVPQDADALPNIYDARVNGGLASQNLPPNPPPCSGDNCKPPPSGTPPDQTPGSSGFSGPGNQGKNLGGSTSPTKNKKCKKGKKGKKCRKARHANTNRGGSK